MSCAEPLSLSSPGPKTFNSMDAESTKVQSTEVQPTENQPTEIEPSAYAQWVSVDITNSFKNGPVSIKHTEHSWGKFYEWPNKDKELSIDDVNKIVIPAGEEHRVSACGRSDAASGTTGSFDLYDNNTKIIHIKWNCPWGSKHNSFEAEDRSKNYYVNVGSWNQDSGAIGTVDVEVARKGT